MDSRVSTQVSPADLKAALDFLTTGQVAPPIKTGPKRSRFAAPVAVSVGISRARHRDDARRAG